VDHDLPPYQQEADYCGVAAKTARRTLAKVCIKKTSQGDGTVLMLV